MSFDQREATYGSVAEKLNRRGLRFMSGRALSASTVGEIVRNPIAVGFARRRVGRVDKTSERDAIALIISREVWDAAQRRVAAQTSARMKPGQRRRTYLFSAIARCADCGETFWGRTVHQPNGRPPVAQLLHAPRGCGRRGTRNEAAISRRVGAWLASWQLDAKTKT